LNALPVPLPVHAPEAQPAQFEQRVSPGHWVSAVHQQGTPDALHVPPGDVTVLQLPTGHAHAVAVEAAVWQSWLSALPLPVHVPVHWVFLFTHLPLEQSPSVTQRHAECAAFRTGAGVRPVMHDVPPPVWHAIELGGGWHPWPSSLPAPVQPVQGRPPAMQCPLSHTESEAQKQIG
jgi:hypothetical protein